MRRRINFILRTLKPETLTKEKLQLLAKAIKGSDKEAFNILFEQLSNPMVRYATSVVDDADSARDIIQDLWFDYWQRREDIEADNIKAYLFSALRKRCYKHIRDHKLTELQEGVVESLVFEEDAERDESLFQERLRRLHLSLETLPERCKEVFLLSRINGLTNEEISNTLEITKRAVENHITKAQRRLRKDISNISSWLVSLI